MSKETLDKRASSLVYPPQQREMQDCFGRIGLVQHFPNCLVAEIMKYLLVVVLLTSLVSLEVFHELSSGDAPGEAVCLAPQSKADAVSDVLLLHLQSHR